MIVNMYVDHLMATPPASAEEVWNATKVHSKLFSDAARRIGLSGSEYDEFRGKLLDGKAVYVRLPRRVDAMSGARRGSVYAVRNAVMNAPVMGWQVSLADGNIVYVPQVCGNISLLRPVRTVAKLPVKRVAGRKVVPAFHPAVAVVPPETPVIVTPTETPDRVEIPPVPPTVAQVVPAAASGGGGFLFFIPALIGGAIATITHTNTPQSPPPPCINGSNSTGVCTAK